MKKLKDEALAVLVEVNKGHPQSLPVDLIKRCYEIERSHQFEHERDLAMDELRRIVEKEAGRLLAKEEGSGK